MDQTVVKDLGKNNRTMLQNKKQTPNQTTNCEIGGGEPSTEMTNVFNCPVRLVANVLTEAT